MGKSSGGAPDTSGLEAATNKSIALQKEIYDLTREDVQPWYNMGVGATSRLSDLLGISGGSMKGREDIYNELLPQYTSQMTTGNQGGNMYRTPDGRILSGKQVLQQIQPRAGRTNKILGADGMLGEDQLAQYGVKPFQTMQTQDQVDYDALNAAVNERLGGQQTPEDYGSLLRSFDMNTFEQDPSYKYRQDQANKALERSMAAQGVTLGGGGYGEINPQAYQAMQELNQDLASQEYGNAYSRHTNDQLNKFNMLMGASGMGQGATNTMAGSGQNYAQNVGQSYTDLAGAQLNAQLAKPKSGGMFGTLLGTAAGAFLGNPQLGAAAGKAIFG